MKEENGNMKKIGAALLGTFATLAFAAVAREVHIIRKLTKDADEDTVIENRQKDSAN